MATVCWSTEIKKRTTHILKCAHKHYKNQKGQLIKPLHLVCLCAHETFAENFF